jgi:hypothetical protein
MILSHSLSYNELASATTDQEDTMRAYVAAEDKKSKRTMLGSEPHANNLVLLLINVNVVASVLCQVVELLVVLID